MTLSHFISILWATNAAADARTPATFSFDDIYEAARGKRLLDFLSPKDPLGFIMAIRDLDDGSVDEALSFGADALEGQETRKAVVGCNPWCMVTAIVLESLAQNFPMELRPIGQTEDEQPEV